MLSAGIRTLLVLTKIDELDKRLATQPHLSDHSDKLKELVTAAAAATGIAESDVFAIKNYSTEKCPTLKVVFAWCDRFGIRSPLPILCRLKVCCVMIITTQSLLARNSDVLDARCVLAGARILHESYNRWTVSSIRSTYQCSVCWSRPCMQPKTTSGDFHRRMSDRKVTSASHTWGFETRTFKKGHSLVESDRTMSLFAKSCHPHDVFS